MTTNLTSENPNGSIHPDTINRETETDTSDLSAGDTATELKTDENDASSKKDSNTSQTKENETDPVENVNSENAASNADTKGVETGGGDNEVSSSAELTTEKEEEDEWMDVLGNGQLKKKTIKPGKSGKPSYGEIVTIRTSGCLDDGTVIDVNDSITFEVGSGDVINAWELALSLMKFGEIAEVVTDPKYAYGTIGREPDVPKDATITYTLELLSVEPPINYLTMTATQLIEHGDKKRERGNYLYSRGEFSQAINSYSQALKILNDEGRSFNEEAEELQRLIDTRVKCYNNLAAAQLKVEAWDAAMSSCDSVLRLQPENVKALFRKGKCQAAKGDVDAAIAIHKKALKIEPQTKIIHQELSRLTTLQKTQDQSQKALYQRMLGGKYKAKKKEKSFRWLYIGSAVAAVLVSVGIAAYRFITP